MDTLYGNVHHHGGTPKAVENGQDIDSLVDHVILDGKLQKSHPIYLSLAITTASSHPSDSEPSTKFWYSFSDAVGSVVRWILP